MAVRLKDVAELAGVSVKTASNVLNNYPGIRPATRSRVQAAMAQLRYRPNLSARNLKHGKAGFLALAVPQMDSPYFAELAARISAEAATLGYIVLLDVTAADPEAERIVLEGMRSHVIDGVIFSPLALSREEIAGRHDDLPMVLLGERDYPKGYDHVAVNSVAASTAITEHLVSLGRRRVAAIGAASGWSPPTKRDTRTDRFRGYAKALAAGGLEVEPDLVREVTSYERADGYAAMQQLLALESPPDAVFCFNDLMAVGALRACVEAGVRVPEDVAVAGFDGIEEGRYANPSLTTIVPDLSALSREALRLVIGRVDGMATPVENVKVPWRLDIRESTAGAPVRRRPKRRATPPEPRPHRIR